MKQITKIIAETKYDPKVVAWELITGYGAASLLVDAFNLVIWLLK